MRKIKISWIARFTGIFKHKLKPYIIEGRYKVIPAFSIGGTSYWMFDSTNEVPTGRFFAAMGIYKEMEMNVDKDYLTAHVKAMDKILSDPKKVAIKYILQLNINLAERLELMPMEDYVYKLASVIFFDKNESIYSYDYDYAKQKIKKWKAAGGTLDFFSNTPLKELVPSLTMPEKDSQTYLTAARMIQETHQALLSKILSENQ